MASMARAKGPSLTRAHYRLCRPVLMSVLGQYSLGKEACTIDLLQLCSSTTPHSDRRFVTRRRRPSIPFCLHPSLALAGHHCPAAFSPSDLPPTGRRQPTYFQVDAAQPRADSPGPPSPAGCSRPSAVPSGVIVTARALLRENGELAGASSVCFFVVIFACVWRMP